MALGHIHKPQKISDQSYYSGSPIPLRFSETKSKSVIIIELKNGKMNSELLSIPLSRALHILKVSESDWKAKMAALEAKTPLTSMVEVQITLTAPRVGLIDEIKDQLEKQGMELLSYLPFYSQAERSEKRHEKLFELSPLELFEEFYKTKYPDSPEVPHELKDDFKNLLEKARHATSQT